LSPVQLQVGGSGNPGPGEYNIDGIKPESKHTTRRIRGKSVKVRKPDIANSIFKSTTGRLLEENINKANKFYQASVGQYET